MMADVPRDKLLVLFDGVCNFCNDSVLFIIDHDPREAFVFAPLDSELGRRVLGAHPELPEGLDSIVLIDAGRAYVCSNAALRIARRLSGPWRVLGLLGLLVPRFLRDRAYRAFAARRYRWFGKSETCRVPTPALRRRFLSLSS